MRFSFVLTHRSKIDWISYVNNVISREQTGYFWMYTFNSRLILRSCLCSFKTRRITKTFKLVFKNIIVLLLKLEKNNKVWPKIENLIEFIFIFWDKEVENWKINQLFIMYNINSLSTDL